MSLTMENDGGGGGGGGGGSTPSIVEGNDELQDAENSRELEPGELVTPPHQQQQQLQGIASPAPKKMLAKDVMNKALRKLTQIDNDNSEKRREELEAIRRKELSQKNTKEQPTHTLENGKTDADAADDSEGLYSDTDSSQDEQKKADIDVEDVQQARKEKQAEAAAAAAPKSHPAPHHAFIGLSPLRFHMRPPCFDFSRMGFMPRMPQRGGMRGMRPPFFQRPPVSNRCAAPRGVSPPSNPAAASNGAQGTAANPGAYGPALPPGQTPSQGRDAKCPHSNLLWTTSQPRLSFLFNLVNECENTEHRDCKQKEKEKEKRLAKETASERAPKEYSKEKQRKQSKEPPKDQKEKQRERCKEQQQRESNKEKRIENSKERRRERSKEQQKESTREKKRERSNEKQRERNKERMDAAKHRENSREKQHKEKQREQDKDKKVENKEKQRERSKEKQREREKEQHREREKEQHREREKEQHREREKEQQKEPSERSRERQMEEANRSREKQMVQRERSKEKQLDRSKEKPVERSRDRERHKKQERSKDRSKEPLMDNSAAKDKSRERSKDHSKDRRHVRSRSSHKSRKSEARAKTPTGTPPTTPPPPAAAATQSPPLPVAAAAALQDQDQQQNPSEESEQLQQLTPPRAKAFDIFAESPPRLNKVSKEKNTESPARKQARIVTPPPERSTTPPLDNRHVPKPVTLIPTNSKPESPKVTTLSEIQSRIGALLEDNDELHLEALLRKTHEHRNKKEQKEISIKMEANETRSNAPPRHTNPFKRETVLTEVSPRRSERDRESSSRRSLQRNGDRRSYSSREIPRRSDEYKERSIKQEKNRSRTPPLLTVRQIKVERNLTPPPRDYELEREVERERKRELGKIDKVEKIVRNGVDKEDEHSPDTDDYIDNWENDDSMVGGDSSTPKNAVTAQMARLNGDDDDSNTLWNAKSTPPPKGMMKRQMEEGGVEGGEETPVGGVEVTIKQPLININEVYDKFMKSIKMGAGGGGSTEALNTTTSNMEAISSTLNSSSSYSTATEEEEEESSSSEEASSSSSSSSSDSSSDEDDDEEDDSSSDEEEKQQHQEEQQQLLTMENLDQSQSQSQSSSNIEESNPKQQLSYKKNNVSRDLRKMQSLEDNLARIQMMRENYDSGDDICEELLKMESLFIMQRNAILNKYRKSELKSEEQLQSEQEQEQLQPKEEPPPQSPVNNIFDANREAIKLTISPFKLSARKPAIFDKDEVEPTPNPVEPKQVKPQKEIAIVKPTIMERSKLPARSQQSHPHQQSQPHPLKRSRTRERSRSRSISRNHFRRNVRPNRCKDSTRSPSPRRRRPLTSPPMRRGRFGKGLGAGSRAGSARLGLGRSSHSRSISRSRTRSRSPSRRRRLKPPIGRRRSSLSPPGKIFFGPRSPPPPPLSRRRSYSRERCYSRSRSPLPFKPPSPPMRRSWSSSRSRSASRRRGSRSRSRTRSRSPRIQSFSDYFVENQNMEAAAYYYNMSLMQQDAMGENYDMEMAYMDTAYNMEHAYAQYTEYSNTTGVASMDYEYSGGNPVELSVLRELPKAPIPPVAVQKGNVLEIVPSMEATVETLTIIPPAVIEEPLEDNSKPKRKFVNFVDKVLPNNESDSEDRRAVQRLVDSRVRLDQKRRAAKAAKEQRMREQLMALPVPPPPLGVKPVNVDKPVLVQKTPPMRYYQFDSVKRLFVRTRERLPKVTHPPRFDPRYMAMLVKSGRLPMPPFMRHRPPPPPAQADAMLQEFFTLHPPPPLHHGMPHYLRGPPPTVTASTSSGSQPIPVLGSQSYPSYPRTPTPVMTPLPAAVIVPAPVPLPLPVPVPVPVPVPLPLLATPPLTSTPPPALIPPYFTPPPLPTLSSHFKIQPVTIMREIMPVDILQKIGPLPKTLDLDVGNPGQDETQADLTSAEPTPVIEKSADQSINQAPKLLEA